MKLCQRLFCAALFLTMLCVSALARADEYADYIAEIKAFEKQLGPKLDQAIRYSDGEKGKALQAILQPERVRGIFDRNQEAARRENKPSLLTKLNMVHAWYEAAFTKNPGAYETEYLDIQDNEIYMLNTYLEDMRKSMPAGSATRSLKEVYTALPNRNDQMVFLMLNTQGNTIQTRLRKQISDGLFSDAGAKRAEAIAARIQLNT